MLIASGNASNNAIPPRLRQTQILHLRARAHTSCSHRATRSIAAGAISPSTNADSAMWKRTASTSMRLPLPPIFRPRGIFSKNLHSIENSDSATIGGLTSWLGRLVSPGFYKLIGSRSYSHDARLICSTIEYCTELIVHSPVSIMLRYVSFALPVAALKVWTNRHDRRLEAYALKTKRREIDIAGCVDRRNKCNWTRRHSR